MTCSRTSNSFQRQPPFAGESEGCCQSPSYRHPSCNPFSIKTHVQTNPSIALYQHHCHRTQLLTTTTTTQSICSPSGARHSRDLHSPIPRISSTGPAHRPPPTLSLRTSRHEQPTIYTLNPPRFSRIGLRRGRRILVCLLRRGLEISRACALLPQYNMASTSEPTSATPAKKSAPAEKKYKCQYCNRAFSRSEHRSRHERSRKCTSFFVVRFAQRGAMQRPRLPFHQHSSHPYPSLTLSLARHQRASL